MGVFDPNPNIRSLDRGGLNTIINAATTTTGLAFTGSSTASGALPTGVVAFGHVQNHQGVVNPSVFYQVDSAGTCTGQFIASNDLVNWYEVGNYATPGLYAIALGVGFRYLSASLNTVGASPVTISVTQ